MAEFTPDSIAQALAVCGNNNAAIAEALNRCLGSQFQLRAGTMVPWDDAGATAALRMPGLIVAITLGSDVLLGAIPADLPLPAWFSQPDIRQVEQLQTLASELARHCLPPDTPADSFVTHAVGDLWETVQECRPLQTAQWLPLEAGASDETAPDAGAATQPPGIWLLWPASEVPLPSWDPGEGDDSLDAMDGPGQSGAGNGWDAAPPPRRNRISRLLNLPVPIIVTLAEKRIELGQLLEIGPGAIVSFEKSCEDLLELHVNNKLYCRGEAVKIGEKFGLKINEVGSVHERMSALLGLR